MTRLHLTTAIATQSLLWMVFAVALVIAPDVLLPLFGLPASPTLVARLFGAELVGLSLASYFTREILETYKQGHLMISYLTCNTIGFVVSLWAMLTHTMNVFGWLLVLLYLSYSITFALFWVQRHQVLGTQRPS